MVLEVPCTPRPRAGALVVVWGAYPHVDGVGCMEEEGGRGGGAKPAITTAPALMVGAVVA